MIEFGVSSKTKNKLNDQVRIKFLIKTVFKIHSTKFEKFYSYKSNTRLLSTVHKPVLFPHIH